MKFNRMFDSDVDGNTLNLNEEAHVISPEGSRILARARNEYIKKQHNNTKGCQNERQRNSNITD